MSNDCWRALTSDGFIWTEQDAELQVTEHSPWRELEAVCQREGPSTLWAEVQVPGRYLRMEARGCPLVCGQALTLEMSMTGAGQRQRRYRWIMREEAGRRVWGVLSEHGVWQFEGPIEDELRCPLPEESV